MKQTGSATAVDGSTFSVTIPKHVVYENFDDEVVLLNLNIGLYHTLNETAGLIWLRIADCDLLEDVVADVIAHYDISVGLARAMVAAMVREIVDEGLVDIHGTWPAWAEWSGGKVAQSDGAPDWPVVVTYRDMHAALVLDPIHEVDASGWPMPKTQAATNGTE